MKFYKQIFFFYKNVAFLHGKKLVKLRKLLHDKDIKYDFFVLLFKNGTHGHQIKFALVANHLCKKKLHILCPLAPF